MRVILAGLLIGLGLVVVPAAGADPQTCPPTCDQIPNTAWPAGWSLPLNGVYHWPDLAALAVPAPGARFKSEELCATPRALGDPRDYAVAAKAVVTAPDAQWQLQAQILHWRGDTWRGGQLATMVFDDAVRALRSCQATAPQFSPSLTTAEPNRVAAVLSGPQIVHQYLLVDPNNSTVSELALWATPGANGLPAVPWAAVSDAKVLDALATPLCGAYLGSCG